MKKIPTLFKREFQDHNVISISPENQSELSSEIDWGEPRGKEVW